MKRYAVILGFVVSCLSISAHAQAWRGVFVGVPGERTDYYPDNRGFKQHPDALSAWRFEFRVPSEGRIAKIRLIPHGTMNEPTEDYDAVIPQRSSDIIVMMMMHTAQPTPSKTEIYTVYPRLGVGYLTETSSFLGSDVMKEMASVNPDIPHASAKVIPLRRVDR